MMLKLNLLFICFTKALWQTVSRSGCNNIVDKSEKKNSHTHKWNYLLFINATVKIGNV